MDTALATAVQTLLREHGYAALTVDAVAARAGVGKAAIYRRHATKQEMVFAVLLHGLREAPPDDTGSLQGDLEAVALRIAGQLARSSAEVMTGLLADVHADPVLGERFEQTYLADERSVVSTLLDRAAARGEITDRPDPATVHVLLLGPLFAWLIMLDEDPASEPRLARTVARMVAAAVVGGTVPPRGDLQS